MSDLSNITSDGGQYTRPVAAITATSGGAVVITANPGRLCRVIVTAAGTGAVLAFYDNASASTGTVLFSTAATTQTVGTIFSPQMPAASGVVAAQITGSPGVCVSYVSDTAYGR